MATSQSILEALSALCDSLVEADCLSKTLSNYAGDDAAAVNVAFVFSRQLDRIRASSESLERLIRQRAVPVLQDMETAVRRVA